MACSRDVDRGLIQQNGLSLVQAVELFLNHGWRQNLKRAIFAIGHWHILIDSWYMIEFIKMNVESSGCVRTTPTVNRQLMYDHFTRLTSNKMMYILTAPMLLAIPADIKPIGPHPAAEYKIYKCKSQLTNNFFFYLLAQNSNPHRHIYLYTVRLSFSIAIIVCFA